MIYKMWILIKIYVFLVFKNCKISIVKNKMDKNEQQRKFWYNE